MLRGFRRGLALGICLLLAGAEQAARGEAFSEYGLKAEFLYQFPKFVTWPKPLAKELALCVYGADPFDGGLAKFEGKTVNQLLVVIKRPATLEAAKACQVLFLNPMPPADLPKCLQMLEDLPILTVSDLPSAWKDGAQIVLVTEPNRVSFRINLSAANRAGLALSSQLMRLARDIK
jgi:hypothetical protein